MHASVTADFLSTRDDRLGVERHADALDLAVGADLRPVGDEQRLVGLGGVLPDSGWEDLTLVPIVRPELRSRLVLAWRDVGPASPAARALIAFARDALAVRMHGDDDDGSGAA